MSGLTPTNGSVEVGGMSWEVERAGHIPNGQVVSMNCVENRGHAMGTVLDQTRLVLIDDGEIYLQLATQGPDGTVQTASHPFQHGTLRAIIDFVEGQESNSPKAVAPTSTRGWLGRMLNR